MPPDPPPAATDPGFELVADPADGWNAPLPVARRANPRLGWWVRGALVVLALGVTAVLGVAVWLNPYTADGSPRSMATHTQLGLPPCSMVSLIGKPCPACGMTTSFALLMHADPMNSVRANWVGTLLCGAGVVVVPWAVWSAWRGKYAFVRSAETAATVGVIVLLVLMFSRWAVVLLAD